MGTRKIALAVLHGNINVPGVSSNVDKTLRQLSGGAGGVKSLSMELTDSTIDCLFNGTVKVGIPLTNVQNFVYAPEAPTPQLVSTKK